MELNWFVQLIGILAHFQIFLCLHITQCELCISDSVRFSSVLMDVTDWQQLTCVTRNSHPFKQSHTLLITPGLNIAFDNISTLPLHSIEIRFRILLIQFQSVFILFQKSCVLKLIGWFSSSSLTRAVWRITWHSRRMFTRFTWLSLRRWLLVVSYSSMAYELWKSGIWRIITSFMMIFEAAVRRISSLQWFGKLKATLT